MSSSSDESGYSSSSSYDDAASHFSDTEIDTHVVDPGLSFAQMTPRSAGQARSVRAHDDGRSDLSRGYPSSGSADQKPTLFEYVQTPEQARTLSASPLIPRITS
ncbi:uncharacterized protein L969DRAFT_90350 [Mixia osmundae IAM 14324]|uniref:Uncharacterized protein n=1 Tax=Mixia osmundae (strain CBS 9802 / IAM 14324 / JCM 22182 / KY 12970) TaxID=764103 RepID=G7E285_MIXOS|nr:uncharacterized protein L969DRAFT_90350 [Mixia osmundae IAM 14324]KEI36817.1 hypothetical protein L969DRAFT_90350 [Mixia osmundae IAM 14324]GAA96945.1 hypothetical protein E5Q_03619 [Mixia osmundae IAM 14324]